MRALSRRLGRGGGTTLPGRLLLRADDGALERMSGRLDHGAVLVSATNGKTTTSAMVAAILEASGERVVHNRAGSNMGWGVATALLDAGPRAATRSGCSRWTRPGCREWPTPCSPRTFLLSNLFRDQLDRYGELELLADAGPSWWTATRAAPASC